MAKDKGGAHAAGGGAPVVIRVVKKKGHGGHHGGSWKVAYADFVTAMMAFFLLMWLLGAADQKQKEAIAGYFARPLSEVLKMGPSDGGSSIIAAPNPGTTSAGKLADGEAMMREMEAREDQQFDAFVEEVKEAIEENPILSEYRDQLTITRVKEGARIEITDAGDHPMFAAGSSNMQPYTKELLHELAPLFNALPKSLIVSGHTDSTPYPGGNAGYSNWELSADRANAARRELVAGGIDNRKVLRVEGLADAVPSVPNDPYNAMNRRISFLVLEARAEQAERAERTLPDTAK